MIKYITPIVVTMSAGTTPEAAKIFMKKVMGCNRLIDAVKIGNRQLVLDVLMECGTTDIQLMCHIPEIANMGAVPTMNEEEEAEFRKNLQRVCNS